MAQQPDAVEIRESERMLQISMERSMRLASMAAAIGVAFLAVTPFAPIFGLAGRFVRLIPWSGPFYLCVGAALSSFLLICVRRLEPLVIIGPATVAGAIYLAWLTIQEANKTWETQLGWGLASFVVGGFVLFLAGLMAVGIQRRRRDNR